VEGSALEDKVARFALRGRHHQPPARRPNAALDVAQVLLQHPDGELELAPQMVEVELLIEQPVSDLLTSSSGQSSAFR
jgi:hypothetical protein